MRRLVPLLTAALVTAGLVALPAPALASTTITLSGSSSGYTDVTFTSLTTLDARTVSYTRAGDYAGFYIARGPFDTSEFALGINESGVGTVWFAGVGTVDFPAGTYRLYLFADAASTVTIPAAGLAASISTSPSTAITDGAGSWATPRSFANPFWGGTGSRTVTMATDDVVVAVARFRYPMRVPATYAESNLCVTTVGGECENGGNVDWGPTVNPTRIQTSILQVADTPRRLGATSLDLRTTYTGLDDAASIAAFGFVVPGAN